jgi:hypothetical protein
MKTAKSADVLADTGASREGLHTHASEREKPADGPKSPAAFAKEVRTPQPGTPRGPTAVTCAPLSNQFFLGSTNRMTVYTVNT